MEKLISFVLCTLLNTIIVISQPSPGFLLKTIGEHASHSGKTLPLPNDSIEEIQGKVFRFGFSVGIRNLLNKKNTEAIAFILPDSTVAIEYGDKLALILSTSITAFPWADAHKKLLRCLGFVANINLAEFSNNKPGAIFNSPIDGGMGLAYGPNTYFAIALTYEIVFAQQPTRYIFSNIGNKIVDKGQTITEIDTSDERYYKDKGLQAWSFKFIYHFK